MSADRYQVLDPLTDEEYAELRDDIAAHGVMVPVTVDENGEVLDGHHRMRAAAETGKDCPTHVVAGLTEDEKVDRAFSLNLKRRQMNNAQKREAIGRYLRRRPEASDRLAAEVIGVTDKTVATVRKALSSIAEIPQLPPRAGPGNRTRRPEDDEAAAKRQAKLEAQRVKDAEKAAVKRAAELEQEAVWRAAHEAVGGAVAQSSKPTPRAVATQDRIKAAMSDCILALTRALQDPGLDSELVRAERLLPADYRIEAVRLRLFKLVKDFGAKLRELEATEKVSRTERESPVREQII